MNLQYLELEAGIRERLLENPGIPVPYLTTTWLTSVCNYMANHNISITLTDQPTSNTARRTDRPIHYATHPPQSLHSGATAGYKPRSHPPTSEHTGGNAG